MPYNTAITLKVVNRKVFSIFLVVLMSISFLSAVLSSQLVLLVSLTLVIFGLGWFLFILDSSKMNDMESMSIILPHAQVRIRSHGESEIEGYLSGQQWCISQLAVLRYKSEGKSRYLVFLSRQQNSNDYRRLRVWLRQNYCFLKVREEFNHDIQR